MAYAALLSLEDTIDGLLVNNPSRSRIRIRSPEMSLEELFASIDDQMILRSAFDHAYSLRSTLEECSEGVGDLDEQMIIEAAIKLEDAIEFSILSLPTTFKLEDAIEFFLLSLPTTFSLNLDHDIHCFVQTAKETKQIIEQKKAAKMIEENTEQDPEEEEEEEEEEDEDVEMVGLCDQFLQIRDMVLTAYEEIEESSHYEEEEEEEEVEFSCDSSRTIWISGMAGVGKTALAKKVFHDPLLKTFFQSRAFVRVGLEFGSIERILQAIIDQLNLDNGGGKAQKSLILLDDVWDPHLIFNLFRKTRLEKEEGIVVLVTSRTDYPLYRSEYDLYFGMKMRFMGEEESWELLRRKVFGEEEDCPPQLVKPGKKIAEKCEGLPLLINAVAPILLSKAQKNPECWNRVAHKPDSVLEEASHQISQILLKSYNQITEHQKLCFLYIASFPLSSVVPHSTIINLWLAEGITEYSCYTRLIYKNLVIDCKKSWSETDAFRLHCSYWYVGKRVAANNKFLYIIRSCADDLGEGIKSHRRLAILENVLLAIKEVHNKVASITNVRSLLCNGPYNQYQVPICWEWKLLRVLGVLTIRFYEFPVEVVKLIRLKYVALTCNANLPPSISKLRNLKFLIVHQHLNIKRVAVRSYLLVEIWDLKRLIHLEIPGRNLPNPPPSVILYNLKRLLDVGVESCTPEVLKSIYRLEKLRIQIELAPDATQISSCFDHTSSLFWLDSFQSVIVNSTLSSPPPPLLKFGVSLKMLSLSGFGYPWEDMSKIAEIWHLEELKLECYAFRGEKWEAKEMRFLNLRYLLIEDTDLVQWTSGDEAFPELWELTMKNCHKLREIPIGDKLHVELIDCNPLAETWAKQCYKYCVKYSWKEKVKS